MSRWRLWLRAWLLDHGWRASYGVTIFGERCDCECHERGVIVMHCIPCCDMCMEKFK